MSIKFSLLFALLSLCCISIAIGANPKDEVAEDALFWSRTLKKSFGSQAFYYSGPGYYSASGSHLDCGVQCDPSKGNIDCLGVVGCAYCGSNGNCFDGGACGRLCSTNDDCRQVDTYNPCRYCGLDVNHPKTLNRCFELGRS